jgi:hypothetical protein
MIETKRTVYRSSSFDSQITEEEKQMALNDFITRFPDFEGRISCLPEFVMDILTNDSNKTRNLKPIGNLRQNWELNFESSAESSVNARLQKAIIYLELNNRKKRGLLDIKKQRTH